MKASVIISFYNKAEWLKFVLTGFTRQSEMDFEVIIADDGSQTEKVDEIKAFTSSLPFPTQHIWHEDKGWQKNIILNKAVVAAQTDYLIFADGDCVPHRHFVKEHLHQKKSGFALAGRRVHLSESITTTLSTQKIANGYLEKTGFLKLYLGRGGEHKENGFYAPQWLRSHINKKDKGIVGSNFSIHKEDLIAINGYDERYLAPAVGEDTDLEMRLRNNGVKVKSIKHLAIQYHLYHQTLNRPLANLELYEQNKAIGMTYTPYGIKKKAHEN